MEDCIRVLQYVRVLDNGGIESLIFNLLEKTDREYVNYDFLLTRNQKESYEQDMEKYGCRKIVVSSKYSRLIPVRFYRSYRSLKQYFETHPYKIVHFQAVGTSFGGALALLAAKKAGIPVRIVHAHSAASKTNMIRCVDIKLGQYLHRKWGTHFMACSKKAAEFSYGRDFQKRIKVHYLKNGIDTKKFIFNGENRSSVRWEFGIQNKFVLGTIGRLSPQKNHIFMVDVLAETLKIRDDAVLLVVGGLSATHEEYAKKVKTYVVEKGLQDKVIFAGERHDAHRIFSAIDAYLFPSLWEGLGIAAVEAQANGLPVFASSHVPEETNLTENMHYWKLEDGPETWARRIAEFSYEDKRKDYSQEIIQSGYDIRSSARELQDIYLELNGVD